MPKMQMAAFFGKNLLSQHLHYLESHESPNFDPNNAFLSRLEAEIITFLPKKAAIFCCCLLQPSYKCFNVAPLPELIVRPQRPLIPKMVLLSALGGQSGAAVRCPHCMHKDVGSNPAAARNENTDFGQTPAQKVPQ